MAGDGRVQVAARVNPDARRAMRVRAAQLDCTLNDLMEALLMHMDDMPQLPQWVAAIRTDADTGEE